MAVRLDTREIGRSGLRTAGGVVLDDFLNEVRGELGRRLYREMADNDPVCGAMLFALSQLFRAAEWDIDPADDTPAAEDAKDWLYAMLFEEMEHTWADLLDEVTSMFPFGFAAHEMLFARRDGRWVLRGLPLRAPESIREWDFDRDTGAVRGLIQRPDDGGQFYIPIERVALFRTTVKRGNPEGRSVLRNSVTTYLRKKIIENAEGSVAQRAAGIVELTMPMRYMDEGAGEDERAIYAALKEIAEKVAQDRTGLVLMPSDVHPDTKERLFNIRFVTAEQERQADMTRIVERQNRLMATTILAQFIFLGQDQRGALSLADNQTTLFARAVGSFLGGVRDELQRKVIGTLWRVNGLDPELMPQLRVGDVESPDPEKLAALLRDTAAAGVLFGPDRDLENEVRTIFKLPPAPELDDDELVPNRDRAPGRDPVPAGDSDPDDGEPDDMMSGDDG